MEYTPAEFLRDYNNSLQHYTVPGYPPYDERLRFYDQSQLYLPSGDIKLPYDPEAPWCPADFYPRHATKPQLPDQFFDHGGSYPPTLAETDQWNDFDVRTDQRYMPVHPFAEAILLGGATPEGDFVHPGGVITPGFYQKRGPRKTVDILLLAPHEGALYGLLIERKDNGLLAIPGGGLEDEDAKMSAASGGRLTEYEAGAIRELNEETGVEIDPEQLTCSGLTVFLKQIWRGAGPDQRSTLHAWPQGEGHVAILPARPSQTPRAGSDARQAIWSPMSEGRFNAWRTFPVTVPPAGGL
jgi:8-oxo-dGTP pyrophosphatase MutT (NUDIX family)